MKKFLKNNIKLIIVAVAAFLVGVTGMFLVKNSTDHEETVTKIGFEDIGELATQEAYCTAVSSNEDAREVFGIDIPGTTSTIIFSYDIEIKAGYDFSAIDYKIEGNHITVTLPEVKLLSSEVKQDSLNVLYQSESIFNDITLDENNEAISELKKETEDKAIANGLYDSARKNAETLLTAFFSKAYNMNEYTIEFISTEEVN